MKCLNLGCVKGVVVSLLNYCLNVTGIWQLRTVFGTHPKKPIGFVLFGFFSLFMNGIKLIFSSHTLAWITLHTPHFGDSHLACCVTATLAIIAEFGPSDHMKWRANSLMSLEMCFSETSCSQSRQLWFNESYCKAWSLFMAVGIYVYVSDRTDFSG